MSRKLLPATIIPPDLYIERSADRQLARIIQGMGRPGYVLVARQMGKTNLLLNARRRLENRELLFVYVDLSSSLKSIDDYYRLILSTLAAVHPVLLGAIPREPIAPARFDSTLREILGRYSGRLVIILDEVDSLANCTFSDQIFSQIRSMYFARANYPVFDRLTYILSGVAEPGDLIKDKNISPFNIGEKIYLGDFNEKEFDTFLANASLNLDEPVRDTLFRWTGGNPRITWDVCADLEEARESGHAISPSLVDRIVEELYLTNFDRAPVDHVRTLVQGDREIRHAVRSIIAGNASEVPDKTRSKLYLAGIVSLQVGQPSVSLKIKNRVLEEALSPKWLLDVDRNSREILQAARAHADDARYDAALPYFEEYLLQTEIEPGSPDALRLAETYLHTGQHAKALEWYTRYLPVTSASPELSARVHFDMGRALLQLNDPQAALVHLRQGASVTSPVQFNATNALAATLIRTDGEASTLEAQRLSESILARHESGEKIPTNVVASALRNLATISLKLGSRDEAKRHIERALALRDSIYQPYLLTELYSLGVPAERKSEILDELVGAVERLIQLPVSTLPDGGIEGIVLKSLVLMMGDNRKEQIESTLAAYERSAVRTSSERYQLLTKLFQEAQKSADTEPYANQFLIELIDKFEDVPAARSDVIDALKLLTVRTSDFRYVAKYIARREIDIETSLDEFDCIALGFCGLAAKNRRDVDLHFRLTRLIDSITDEPRLKQTVGYCWLFSQEIDRRADQLDTDGATAAARTVLELVETLASKSEAPLSLYQQMKERAQTHLKSVTRPERATNRYKHLGRNTWVKVRYSDGQVVRHKFKVVQRDLVLGVCELVE